MDHKIALNFEDGLTRFVVCPPDGDRGRHVLPRRDQHSARLPRRRVRNLQGVLRVREFRVRLLHRGRADAGRGPQGLLPAVPDEADLRPRGVNRRRGGRLQGASGQPSRHRGRGARGVVHHL